MKHRVYGKKLGRDKNERAALFKNLVQDLILHEKIKTTEAKAKAIKGLVDKLITQAKSPNTRRLVAQFLVNKDTQEKLFSDIAPRLKSRISGYTSVIKLGKRLGDGAMMVQMKLLVESEQKTVKKETSKSSVAKTDKQITDQPVTENRKQKTDNKKKVETKKK